MKKNKYLNFMAGVLVTCLLLFATIPLYSMNTSTASLKISTKVFPVYTMQVVDVLRAPVTEVISNGTAFIVYLKIMTNVPGAPTVKVKLRNMVSASVGYQIPYSISIGGGTVATSTATLATSSMLYTLPSSSSTVGMRSVYPPIVITPDAQAYDNATASTYTATITFNLIGV